MKTFCTIITSDYLPFANVLFCSLQKHTSEINLQVLIVDDNNFSSSGGITVHRMNEVIRSAIGRNIVKKYTHSSSDHFRWAMKPVFISYLLQNGFDKVIYLDPDIYFVNSFDFLFKQLDQSSIILTPHWSNIEPAANETGLLQVLQDGLFNAGFVGSNKNGLDALRWWAEACHFKTEKNVQHGLYVDQKYLDILPVYFDNVEILKHRGCNLASWNVTTCKREIINGKLTINGEFEPVFIHFAKETIANIINHNDPHLRPYLEEYAGLLKQQNFNLEERFDWLDFSKMNSKTVQLKHKLRLRTRLKRFLYNLSQKI